MKTTNAEKQTPNSNDSGARKARASIGNTRRIRSAPAVGSSLAMLVALGACEPGPELSAIEREGNAQHTSSRRKRVTRDARTAPAPASLDAGTDDSVGAAAPANLDGGAEAAPAPAPLPAAMAWRPFSADSPWNTKIPANAPIDGDSPALIADFATSAPNGATIYINMQQWTVPVYWVDASTPKVLVRAEIGGEGFATTDGFNATAMIPIPSGAIPDPMSDGHMLVIDRSTMTEWGFFQARPDGSGWGCTLCAAASLTGTGVRAFKPTNSTWYTSHGARACGFPLVAGLLRPESVRAGRVEHALTIAYRHIRAGLYTSPASTAQSRIGDQAIKTRGIPCGGRIQLDPGLNVDALGLSAGGRVVARALQEYGAYVGDYSDGITLYAEDSPQARAAWNGLLSEGDLARIDLRRFRVLALGPLTDDGNGD
jgi:hypothetical protein